MQYIQLCFCTVGGAIRKTSAEIHAGTLLLLGDNTSTTPTSPIILSFAASLTKKT